MAQIHVINGATDSPVQLTVRKIGLADIRDALAHGLDDFAAMPSHVIFLGLIYPIVGFVLARMAFGYDVLPLLYPLATGFALVGPLAAVGLYELSRRREQGLDTHWTHVFDIRKSPSFPAIVALGALLMLIFIAWLATAQAIYQSLFGVLAPSSLTDFAHDVLTTESGWELIILGNGIGFLYAVVVLTISVVSFPLLLDRDVGAAVALWTSVRAVALNPVTMAAWGLIVAVLLHDRLAAVLLRPCHRDADPRPFDVAPLSQGRASPPREYRAHPVDEPQPGTRLARFAGLAVGWVGRRSRERA